MQPDQTATRVTEVTRSAPTMSATPGEHPQKTYAKKKAIFRVYQIIWYNPWCSRSITYRQNTFSKL